jgi:Kef-type K+ transport system membrane component KefB
MPMLSPRTALLLIAFLLIFVPWLCRRSAAIRRMVPLAVIQILCGVLLGPSGLGQIAPGAYEALFPAPVLAAINGLATVGVLLFVFVSGLYLDGAQLRDGMRRLGGPAAGSIGVPLILGLGAGFWIAWTVPTAMGPRGGVTTTAVAIAICVAVTALPVLAAILRELGLIGSRLGQTALALAALNDAALWLMIAVLLALSSGSAEGAILVLGLSVLWLGVMLLVVRPLLARIAGRGANEATMLVVSLSVAFASAALAESFGLGYMIGGFVAGAIMPAQSRPPLLAQLERLTAAALLPFFFVATGLRALIEPGSLVFLGMFALLSLATIFGKVLGTALPARRSGENWPSALAMGALMQTKGLMEVVVLSVLLDAGLIGRSLFSALVAMAMLCTVLTVPMVRWALGPHRMVDAAASQAGG